LHDSHHRVSALTNGYQTAQSQQRFAMTSAQRHPFKLSGYYSISKRTGIYALQAFQRTRGNTPGTDGFSQIISAVTTIGDGIQTTPSSQRRQFAAGVGIVHRFSSGTIVKRTAALVPAARKGDKS
jgi:predicted porin